jgi:DegV family protein with EDD domain
LRRTVAVIADSVACLTREQVQEYSIGIVPLLFTFEGKTYRDWVDITPTEAYKLFLKNPDAFRTSAPSPVDFLNGYRETRKQADIVLCITLSSKLSTTYESADIAKMYAAKELPGTTIEVLDSLTAAAAEGFVVLAAAKAANQGKSLAEVKQAAEQVRDRVVAILVLDTVKHVYRSGRIPKFAAQAGSILNIKPLFNISGRVNLSGVVRSRERGIEQIIEKVQARVGNAPLHVAVMHAYALEAAEELKQRVAREFNCVELFLSEFSPLMGYACGTGTLGLAFYTEV